MCSRIVLYEESDTGRGTSTAIQTFGHCLSSRGFDVIYGSKGSDFNLDSKGNLTLPSLDSEAQKFLELIGCEVFYSLTPGDRQPGFLNPNFKVINHVVFPIVAPLKGINPYVSRSLKESLDTPFSALAAISRSLLSVSGRHLWKGGDFAGVQDRTYLHHVGNFQSPKGGLRERLGIPEGSFVMTSLSHDSQLDVPWVRHVVFEFIEQNAHVYFLGSHLKGYSHPRIISPFSYTREKLPEVLGAVDLTIHARKMGESFGMGLVESLSAGVPAIAWRGGRDKNHLRTLSGLPLVYTSRSTLMVLLREALEGRLRDLPLGKNLGPYSCESVVEDFIRLLKL